MSAKSWPRWASALFVVCAVGCASERPEAIPSPPSSPARVITEEVSEPDRPRIRAIGTTPAGVRQDEASAAAYEAAHLQVQEGIRRASSGRALRARDRVALSDALGRLDVRITSVRVDHLRGRIELDSIEVEQLKALHTRCHRLIGSLALVVGPSVDELDRHARALEGEVDRALASWPGEARGG